MHSMVKVFCTSHVSNVIHHTEAYFSCKVLPDFNLVLCKFCQPSSLSVSGKGPS